MQFRAKEIIVCTFLSVSILISGTQCERKILLFPSPFYSHTASVYAIGKELMQQGHEVHMLQHWSFKIPESWLKDEQMVVHRYGGSHKGGYNVEEYVADLTQEYLEHNHGFEFYLDKMQQLSRKLADEMLMNNDELIETLDSHKFDVVIVDSVFFMRFSCLIPHRLRVPMVTYSDSINPWLVRMPWLPSVYSPMRMSTDSSSSFLKRLRNFLYIVSFRLFPHSPNLDESILEKYRKYNDFDSLEELISKSHLFLVPGDPILDIVRPTTANVVYVGGLTTDLHKASADEPLPPKYKQFLEASKPRGTILISFGSMVHWYPEKLASTLIETFKLLPEYRFLWKFPNKHQVQLPSNVMAVEWMPQSALLHQREIKLFVTHSGNNGQFEAIFHGVPMLAVPLFTDQIRNAKRVVERGYGEQIDYRSASPEDFARLIKKVVQDSSYKVRTEKASEIFKNQPQSPAVRAAFWVDHVIKYGADHLRPAGNELYFWQYLCIDIMMFCMVLLKLFVVTIYFAARFLVGRFKRRRVQSFDKKWK